jgi:hypothetical protein
MTHEIVVGNIGTVYTGMDEVEARQTYITYVEQSINGVGRAANEHVVWLKDGDMYIEHVPIPLGEGA